MISGLPKTGLLSLQINVIFAVSAYSTTLLSNHLRSLKMPARPKTPAQPEKARTA